MNGQARISGLNYDALLSADDHKAYRLILENEIITRSKLASGYTGLKSRFGIVDGANPALVTTSETSRPLLVRVSDENSLAVSVNPGVAVAENGTILEVASFLNQVTLAAAPQAGKTYVILLQASLNTEAGVKAANNYGIVLASQELVIPEVVAMEYVSGWKPVETQVCLAVVTVVERVSFDSIGNTTTTQELQIDQTQAKHAFNRPWFTTVDTEHRSALGSGTVTAKNPHATSINDLTVPGTVGVFQGLTGQGLVVSRDRYRNKMTGAGVCLDTVTVSQIQTDTDGSLTKGSVYNAVGARYTKLSRYPISLGSVYNKETKGNAIAADIIPGTNILVFGPNEDLVVSGLEVSVEYTSCAALEPPRTLSSNLLSFTQPATDEVIVAGGFTYPSIPDPSLSMDGFGPFARRYRAYLLPTGVIAAFPQIVLQAQSALGTVANIIPPMYPARLGVGLTNTTGASTLNVTVTITGLAVSELNGTVQTKSETLTISPGTGFQDQTVSSTNYDLAGQIVFTENVFKTINTISVNATDAGSNPQIQVWAEIEPGLTPEVNDAAPICRIGWDGGKVQEVRDMRRVQRQWSPERMNLAASGEVELDSWRMARYLTGDNSAVGTSLKLFTEDFEDLKFFDSARGFVGPTQAKGTLGFNTSFAPVAGDTITLTSSPAKVLTATSGAPTLPGQFEVGTLLNPLPLSTIIQNIIAAINATAFDSKVTASLSATNSLNIILELDTPRGIAANSIAISTSNSGAVDVAGWSFAVDGFGECYLERAATGLSSVVVPDNSNLSPYQHSYRNRYRSRAIALPPSVNSQTQFLIQVHGEDKAQQSSVRMRGSKLAGPRVWDAWQVATVTPAGEKGLYLVTFMAAMHKVQVEYYGKARGISVWAVEP